MSGTTPGPAELTELLLRCAYVLADEVCDDADAQDRHDALRALADIDACLGTTFLAETRTRLLTENADPDTGQLG